jgi:Na+-driven multidrug efflux pump
LFTFSLVAKNRQKHLLLVNGTALFINAILNIIFLPRYGIIAAAISTILCEIVVFVLLMYEIVKKRHPSLREINPKIPSIIEKIVDKALEKDVAVRYQSAGLMAEHLRKIAERIDQLRKKKSR